LFPPRRKNYLQVLIYINIFVCFFGNDSNRFKNNISKKKSKKKMAKYCKSTPNNTDFHFILDPASKKNLSLQLFKSSPKSQVFCKKISKDF